MSNKEDILRRFRANVKEKFDMPNLNDIKSVTYEDVLRQFIDVSESVGAKVVKIESYESINDLIKKCYPEAKTISSNLPEVTIATSNPDDVEDAQTLNGTDVGVIKGEFGVAENGCIWIPQTMKEKAVCFISENLIIILEKDRILNNMHEAYKQIAFNDYGYGTFISGPSKTADIAQVLVMGAQAARSVTVVLV
ncbi:MAG: LUD domain-containing protein [Prevotella sp.]|nr:LUD domain-containing protein [Prevotella sp.]MBR1621689.1 LUD domain-containing protein [Prevotella sp.]